MKRSNLKKLALLCGVLSVSSHLAYAQDHVDAIGSDRSPKHWTIT
jgi:hypothetical protein